MVAINWNNAGTNVVETKAFDPDEHAAKLSRWIVAAFVINVTFWTVFTACTFGFLVLATSVPNKEHLDLAASVAAWLQALSAVLSGPLGYVLAYYFHKQPSKNTAS